MYIVTGGAGFIGSCIVRELNQRGIEDILVVDQLGKDDKWRNLVELSYFEYIDKEEFLLKILSNKFNPQNIQAVFHMGACSTTTEKDADYLMKNNYFYTCQLAQWAVQNNIRFIYASSAATYGDGKQGYSDTINLKDVRPLNMYGYSKALFDLKSEKIGFTDKIVGLKFFNVYGYNESHKDDMRSVVHKAYEQIIEHGVVKLFKSHHPDFEDGKQLRDFIYVKDAVQIALYFLDHPEINGIFNVGTGQARSFKDLVTAVFSAMDIKPNIKYIDMPKELQKKYQYYTQADMTKLFNTGYNQPFYSLEEGVYDYVKNDLFSHNN